MHPALYPGTSIKKLTALYEDNLNQIFVYLQEYCATTNQKWCKSEIASFEQMLTKFEEQEKKNLKDHVNQLVEMSKFANQKFKYYQSIWIEYDDVAFIVALCVGTWTLVFNLAVNFSGLQIKGGEQNSSFSYIGAVFVSASYAALLIGIINIYVSVAAICTISFF